MFDFGGKVVLVAGGAGWLGSPISKQLAGEGASVTIADIDMGRAVNVDQTRKGLCGAPQASLRRGFRLRSDRAPGAATS